MPISWPINSARFGAGGERDRSEDPIPPAPRRRGVMPLFRRRQVWLPTLSGTLVLLALVSAALLALGLRANDFLALNAPTQGVHGAGTRALVVEGWIDEADLLQAIAVARRGRYDRVLTTGGPIEPWSDVGHWGTFAERAAAYLRTHGVTEVPVIAVPAPASVTERTYLSAVQVREWAQRSGARLGAIDVFSVGAHARRSRAVYRLAFGSDVEIGVLAAVPQDFDAQRWWASSSGVKSVIGEILSLAWTTCCFWPAAPEPVNPAAAPG